MSDNIMIPIKKRPWYEWLLWVFWTVVLVFIFQNALASGGEMETRAADDLLGQLCRLAGCRRRHLVYAPQVG